MKMLMMVGPDAMKVDFLDFLIENGITAYTQLNKVEGTGKTGTVLDSFFYPGSNVLIFAVLQSDQADRVISSIRAFAAKRLQAHYVPPVPFRVFALPCEQIV